jgi:hypothetical protein
MSPSANNSQFPAVNNSAHCSLPRKSQVQCRNALLQFASAKTLRVVARLPPIILFPTRAKKLPHATRSLHADQSLFIPHISQTARARNDQYSPPEICSTIAAIMNGTMPYAKIRNLPRPELCSQSVSNARAKNTACKNCEKEQIVAVYQKPNNGPRTTNNGQIPSPRQHPLHPNWTFHRPSGIFLPSLLQQDNHAGGGPCR